MFIQKKNVVGVKTNLASSSFIHFFGGRGSYSGKVVFLSYSYSSFSLTPRHFTRLLHTLIYT